LSEKQKTLARNIGLNHQRKDPNAIDIDSRNGQIEPTAIRFTKLTDSEKATLRARGMCFRCCQDGHTARNCLKNGSTEYRRPAPTQIKQTTKEDTPEAAKDKIEELMDRMNALMVTKEDKQKYFDLVIEKGFV
jgi:hypothetical protein